MKSWPVNGIGDITNISADTLLYELVNSDFSSPISYLAFCTEAQYDSIVAYIQGLNARIKLTNVTTTSPSSKVIFRDNNTLPAYYQRLDQSVITENVNVYNIKKLTFQAIFSQTKGTFLPVGGKLGDIYLVAARHMCISIHCTNSAHYTLINNVAQYSTRIDGVSADANCPTYLQWLNAKDGTSRTSYVGYTWCFGIMRYGDTYQIDHNTAVEVDFTLLNLTEYSKVINRYAYPSVETTNDESTIQRILEWDIRERPESYLAMLKQKMESIRSKVDTLLL